MQIISLLDKPIAAVSNDGQADAKVGLYAPVPLLVWIVFCVFCNCAGWILSAFHQLNSIGYAAAFVLSASLVLIFRNKTFSVPRRGRKINKLTRRFRRLFPLSFLVLAILALIGGLLYAPNNFDALAYRTSRVLHWLSEERWHWIHTGFQRLNTRGCGMEWITAPFIVFTRTDRLFFLINAVCFLLLPGRVFTILTRLAVRPRVAWHWMWLFPTGYCFLLQAGSIGNDLVGALFAMAAIELALRARESGRISYIWLSVLSAGLMTAGKTFNLLLLPAWLVAIMPSLRLLRSRWIISGLIAVLAACTSLIPTALLNLRFCGDWTGQTAEKVAAIQTGAPILHIVVNALLLMLHNLVPPVFPFAGAWNQMMQQLLPASLVERLAQHFEPAGARIQLGEMQMEESAGLGFGVTILLLVTLAYRCSRSKGFSWPNLISSAFRYETFVPLCGWLGALFFMTQSGLSCPARYMAPFYVLLAAPLLAGRGGHIKVLRKRWWRWACMMVFLLAGLLIVVCPSRPLWPAVSLLRAVGASQSSQPLIRRAWTVYSVYGQRSDAFEPVRLRLPENANPLGFVTSDDPETSLWRPFGSRRILHVTPSDTTETMKRRGIRYLLINAHVLRDSFNLSLEQWLAQNNAELIERSMLELRAGKGPSEWFLVKRR